MDAPDGPKWLSGNELVLTSSYIFEHDESIMYKFIEDLIDSGAVGLGIKTGRFMVNIPEKVIKLSNEFDFVIIEVPYKFVWSDIISLFYELWYRLDSNENTEKYELKKLREIYEANKWGSHQLMNKLSEIYNIPMAIINKKRKVKAYNKAAGIDDMLKNIEITKSFLTNVDDEILNIKGDNIIVKLIPSSVMVQEDYIVAMSKNREYIVEILDIFKMLNKFKLEDNLVTDDRNQLYKDFMKNMISGKITPYNIKEFEKNRNYSGQVYNGVMIITGKKRDEVYKEIINNIKENRTSNKNILAYSCLGDEAEELVVIFEWIDFDQLVDVNISLRYLLSKLNNDWLAKTNTYIFVGNLYEMFDKIRDSYKEALETKKIGQVLWNNQYINFYSNIYIYTLYNNFEDQRLDLSEIYYLDDKKNQLNFNVIETLEAYIESGSYKKAANILFIHENTLRYRIKRISELLNINLDSGFNLYNLMLKIKLWKLNT